MKNNRQTDAGLNEPVERRSPTALSESNGKQTQRAQFGLKFMLVMVSFISVALGLIVAMGVNARELLIGLGCIVTVSLLSALSIELVRFLLRGPGRTKS
jgi:hypothetical protein